MLGFHKISQSLVSCALRSYGWVVLWDLNLNCIAVQLIVILGLQRFPYFCGI